jgi:hypothetical protein
MLYATTSRTPAARVSHPTLADVPQYVVLLVSDEPSM